MNTRCHLSFSKYSFSIVIFVLISLENVKAGDHKVKDLENITENVPLKLKHPFEQQTTKHMSPLLNSRRENQHNRNDVSIQKPNKT